MPKGEGRQDGGMLCSSSVLMCAREKETGKKRDGDKADINKQEPVEFGSSILVAHMNLCADRGWETSDNLHNAKRDDFKALENDASIAKDLRQFLNSRFQKGSVDHDLQNTIRDNLYLRTVPVTTRLPRDGEVNGVDYTFLTPDEFMTLERSGNLLESGIYEGNHYGTPKPSKEQPVSPPQSSGSSSNLNIVGLTLGGLFPGAHPSSEGKRKRNRSNVEAMAAKNMEPELIGGNLLVGDGPGGGLENLGGPGAPPSYYHAGDSTDTLRSDLGPLPPNWEKAYTERGEVYFIDHNSGTSHWLDPRLSKFQKKSLEECLDDELPYGWEKIEDPHYGTYYIDHVNRKTQYENPVIQAKQAAQDDFERAFFTRNPNELRGERFKTTLVKSSRGLGFTIVGGDDTEEEFLQIKSVVPNGPAWLDGKLQTGDVLVCVNETCVLGFTHHDMVSVFQSITPGETVTLEVCRGYPLPFDPNDPNTEVVTTVAVTAPEKIKNIQRPSSTDILLNDTSGMRDFDNPGKPEFLSINIVKGAMGFGFTIADSAYGQKVKKILDRQRCKNLMEGDILVDINTINVRNMCHGEVVQVLKDCARNQEATVTVQRGGLGSPSKNKLRKKDDPNISKQNIYKDTVAGMFRSKTPTADLYSTQQKEVMPNRPKTPLVDTRNRPKTPILLSEQRPWSPAGSGSPRIDVGSDGLSFEKEGRCEENGLDNSTSSQLAPYDTCKATYSYSDSYDSAGQDIARSPLMQHLSDRLTSTTLQDVGPLHSTVAEYARSRSPANDLDSDTLPQREIWGNDHGHYDYKTGDSFSDNPYSSSGLDSTVVDSIVPSDRSPSTEYLRHYVLHPYYNGYEGNGHYDPGYGYGYADDNHSSDFVPHKEFGYPYSMPGYNPQVQTASSGSLPSSTSGYYSSKRKESTSFEHEQPHPSNVTRYPRDLRWLGLGPAVQVYPASPGLEWVETLVTLVRQETGFGFRIVGGTEEGSQVGAMVSIGHIVPGGAADLDGRLCSGDEIVSVDSQTVLSKSHHHVVQLMGKAAANGRVTLGIRRRIPTQVFYLNNFYSSITKVLLSSISIGDSHHLCSVTKLGGGKGGILQPVVKQISQEASDLLCSIYQQLFVRTSKRESLKDLEEDRDIVYSTIFCGIEIKGEGLACQDVSNDARSDIGYPYDVTVTRRESEGFGFVIISSVNKAGSTIDDTSSTASASQREDDGLTGEEEQYHAVELSRGTRGFGFSIRGGREFQNMPLFVLQIAENGPAALDGTLKIADQIIEINSINTKTMTHAEAIEIIRNGGPTVRLLVRRGGKVSLPPPIVGECCDFDSSAD
ncbi:unnamed protein product [Timema podura]|uniref:Membrane-associated guanylate kinase, WW and PDZ domain-containing protein 2 n=1 Tax=Timema podura TaxID=61482 RepID=A0ABN7NC07_TIMPD|nr:unnamed protein product [Timema podura]